MKPINNIPFERVLSFSLLFGLQYVWQVSTVWWGRLCPKQRSDVAEVLAQVWRCWEPPPEQAGSNAVDCWFLLLSCVVVADVCCVFLCCLVLLLSLLIFRHESKVNNKDG